MTSEKLVYAVYGIFSNFLGILVYLCFFYFGIWDIQDFGIWDIGFYFGIRVKLILGYGIYWTFILGYGILLTPLNKPH